MGKGNWSAPSRHRINGRYRASRPAAAIGWAPRTDGAIGETVVAVIDRDLLNGVLATLHGNGFGANTRVLDGARGDLAAQIARSGVPGPGGDLTLGERPTETAVVLVHSPGRGAKVATLLEGHQPRDLQIFNKPESRTSAPTLTWPVPELDPAELTSSS